jgi:cell division protein FtsW (lipid II flippase)
MDDQASYERAKKRVQAIRGFYIHATVYALVNTFLAVLNIATSPTAFWAIWPILGWGMGLAMHGIAVFGFSGLWGKEWEERKIKELMERNRPQ